MLKLFCRRWYAACSVLLMLIALSSCLNEKKLRKELLYLQGNLDTAANYTVKTLEANIQKGDMLAITVYSDNPEATAIYNQAQVTAGSTVSAPGYLVDQDGNIRFQGFGIIHVEGMNKLQLMKEMDEKLKAYLTNPYTDIRFLNFKVNVIGEVAKPGPVTIPEGKLSILELIGLAGDLTVYGRRDNVLIIREKEGKREFGRINLHDANLFQSPYFYLQQNDVVFVEANKRKPSGNEQQLTRNLTIASTIAGLVSTIIVIYTLIDNAQ
jgi:polysaccharide export outer membrane protein